MLLNLFKPWLYYYCIFFRGRNGRWERVDGFFVFQSYDESLTFLWFRSFLL